MCLILDANIFSAFLDPKNDDMKPVRDWLHKMGNIVYSPTETLEKELNKSLKMVNYFKFLSGSGQLTRIPKKKVEDTEISLKKEKELKSNDAHIIALALVSGAKLLVSGDEDLHTDFKKIVKGKIYQNKNHKKLLTKNTCP